MLRQDKYLFLNHDDKWSLGTKKTSSRYDDKITMTVRGYDKPESGKWKFELSNDVTQVTVENYTPEYPQYYEVKHSNTTHLDGFYERLSENKNFENIPVFKKRAYASHSNSFVIFLNLD